jgi:hypothetical protein
MEKPGNKKKKAEESEGEDFQNPTGTV